VIVLLAFSPEHIARFEQDTVKRANLSGRKKRFGLKERFHARVVLPFARKLHESDVCFRMHMIDLAQISLLNDRAGPLDKTAIVVNEVQSFDSEFW
jgi:hypothetical protein